MSCGRQAMNFASDTTAPAHPSILAALGAANDGNAASYGEDMWTERVRGVLAAVFDTEDFDYWITTSGTASNALALACFCPPMGAILCHAEAHIERDERGAPEFFTGGGKLRLLPGFGAKIDLAALLSALEANDPSFVHETPIAVLSLTNLTECGTAYSPGEVAERAAAAHAAGLTVHLDGARLANAVASLGEPPSAMSWRAGVDVLTLGLTKTGAIGCEIILLFGPARSKARELRARAKRAGHMPPKMRFLAAQAVAMLSDGLWLELAGRANSRARQLAEGFAAAGFPLAYPCEGNEVFVMLPPDVAAGLQASGAAFYRWPDGSYRFVCGWSTSAEEVDALLQALRER